MLRSRDFALSVRWEIAKYYHSWYAAAQKQHLAMRRVFTCEYE